MRVVTQQKKLATFFPRRERVAANRMQLQHLTNHAHRSIDRNSLQDFPLYFYIRILLCVCPLFVCFCSRVCLIYTSKRIFRILYGITHRNGFLRFFTDY